MTRNDIRSCIDHWLDRLRVEPDTFPSYARSVLYRCGEYAAEYGHWPSMGWLVRDLAIAHRNTLVRILYWMRSMGYVVFSSGRRHSCEIALPIFTITHTLQLKEANENQDSSLPVCGHLAPGDPAEDD